VLGGGGRLATAAQGGGARGGRGEGVGAVAAAVRLEERGTGAIAWGERGNGGTLREGRERRLCK
jgi:hypothetical protein